jgi:hypothetical protein
MLWSLWSMKNGGYRVCPSTTNKIRAVRDQRLSLAQDGDENYYQDVEKDWAPVWGVGLMGMWKGTQDGE